MGREVRMVPANWKHPTKTNGEYIPLYGECISKAIADWEEGKRQWALGFVSDYKGGWEPKGNHYDYPWEEYTGGRPEASDYFPDWPDSARTHYQMYETCTEGTPISPPMETPEKLARWLADNGASAFGSQTATYEQWLKMIRAKWAPSAMTIPGEGIVSGVAAISKVKE